MSSIEESNRHRRSIEGTPNKANCEKCDFDVIFGRKM